MSGGERAGGDVGSETGEAAAVESLRELGLSKYEAQVFIALQKLGVGSASDVDAITEVPRSQVYGAAESLEERGLVEVQQSNPIQYRAVELEEARDILRDRFEREQERAFDYLERASEAYGDHAEEHQDGVWTVHGQDTVSTRVRQLVADADERVLLATSPDLLDDTVVEALRDRASDVEVTVLSDDEAVIERFADDPGIQADRLPEKLAGAQGGRVLAVDGGTILLSILGDEEPPDGREETAIWSSDSGLAVVLLTLIHSHLGEHVDLEL